MKKLSFIFALITTFACGFCDAYSYILRDGVFTSMQTGNIVKLMILIFEPSSILRYLLPIVAFVLGIIIAKGLNLLKNGSFFCIISQIVLTLVVFILPFGEIYNILANCILSIVCAIVFENYRICNDKQFTATMCTNNLRLFSEGLFDFVFFKTKNDFLFYLIIIFTFAGGCFVGKILCDNIFNYSILVMVVLNLILLVIDLVLRKKKWDIK